MTVDENITNSLVSSLLFTGALQEHDSLLMSVTSTHGKPQRSLRFCTIRHSRLERLARGLLSFVGINQTVTRLAIL